MPEPLAGYDQWNRPMPETEQKRAAPIKRCVEVTIVVERPERQYPKESLDNYAKRLERWARDFEEFVRDHRSQDPVHLTVQKTWETVCSLCGQKWEEDDGRCAWCAVEVEGGAS